MSRVTGERRKGRSLLAFAVVACLALAAVPGYAYAAATWANVFPAPDATIHIQPGNISADLFGSPSPLYKLSAQFTLDGVTKPITVTQKSATGHWVLYETLQPDGVTYKTTWAWEPDPPLGSTKWSLTNYPSTLGDGQHRASISIRDTSVPANTYTKAWWFWVQAPPSFGTPKPYKGTTVTTASPIISVPVADNSWVDYCEVFVNGVHVGGIDISAVSGTATMQVGPLANGPNTILVQAFDGWGNEADKVWSFTVAAP